MVSVALTTYNGIKYLEEQLDSLRLQTRKPDEVIIVDDCSNDGTYEFIKEYIKTNSLSYWFLIRNEKNQGWKKNFRIALCKCNGDFVFLCDQDDIWDYKKIEAMEKQMKKNNSILLLASNYSVINIDRKDKVSVPGLKKNDDTIKQIEFSYKAFTIMRPGCTFCVRKELIRLMMNLDVVTQAHDLILWELALLYDGLYLFNRITMKYRRHSDSASSPDQLTRNRRYNEAREMVQLLDFLERLCRNNGMKRKADLIKENRDFVENRVQTLRKGSIIDLIHFQLINYKYYATLRNMFSDEYLLIMRK